ncbi:MAG: dTDP-4-amino-4,6-dideoxygalactose transaminase [Deltaproteobacteria bacterium]|nr:dTDP-4-amino-4,6-dideoxygalactose transaminase [Deltaproteobacteria bacterium]
MRIPFSRPCRTGRELEYIEECLASSVIAGDGAFTKRCKEILERIYAGSKVLLTTSCTHALEMCSLLLDIGPGDEVLLPSFTFVSTANAVALRGARPVFVDVREDTLNIDESLCEARVTERTKAIFVVHYGGVGAQMEAMRKIADGHGLKLVEDAAQGLGATWGGRPLGGIGDLGALSFHESKNIVCGEGGALIINRADLVDRATIIREKGTNRTRFLQGLVDKYTWTDIGSSYLPSDILAAYLCAQLESLDAVNRRRRAIFDYYLGRLSPLEQELRIRTPRIPAQASPNGHLFYVLLESEEERNRVIAGMRAAGIMCVFHYVPLHLSPMGARFGFGPGDLPVTESIAARLVRLPLFYQMTDEEAEEVVDTLLSVLGEGRTRP